MSDREFIERAFSLNRRFFLAVHLSPLPHRARVAAVHFEWVDGDYTQVCGLHVDRSPRNAAKLVSKIIGLVAQSPFRFARGEGMVVGSQAENNHA